MDKYVIFKTFSGIQGTTEANYNARIQNARKIQNFTDFNDCEEVKEYVIKYFGYAPENVVIL